MTEIADARAALNNLVINCPELQRLEALIGQFNAFRVLGIEHMEIRHSNMLGWLLRPNESHGLFDGFLKHFLMYACSDSMRDSQALGKPLPEPVEIDALQIQSISVLREWLNIDLLINISDGMKKWLFVIENKVNSKQHSDQLSRYQNRVGKEFPDHDHFYFLLTKKPETPEDKAFVNISYEVVHRALESCIAERQGSIADGPMALIKDYKTLLEQNFMEDSEIAKLSRLIYTSHKLAIDTIIENLPDSADVLGSFLTNKIEGRDDLVLRSSNSTYIRFIPRAWNNVKNLSGPCWAPDGAFILIEVRVRAKRPSVKIVSGRAPLEWVKKVFNDTSQKPFTRKNTWKESPTYVTLDSIQSGIDIDKYDLDEEGKEELCSKTWKWLESTLANEKYQQKIKVIQELIQELPEPNSLLPGY